MAYIYNLTDTWNAVGTAFNGIKMAVTNTASAAGSYLINLTVSGATTASFTVDKDGNMASSGTLSSGANSGTLGTATFYGSTSGSVAVKAKAVAGTGTIFELPATNGTNTYALTTNGSGVTSWGQIDLTAAVTGILPVANGGTGLNTLATGYIPYGNATSAFSSSADLVFDGSRLGLGTATPSTTLGRNLTINGLYAGSNAGFVLQSATVERALMYANETVSFFGTSTATPMLLGSQGTERVRIQSAGNTVPSADNSYTLGADGIRWASVWAANGTIQTSDENSKTDIVESPLGLAFVNALEAKAYKYVLGGNIVTPNPDDPTDPTITPVAGKRQHFGFLAQQVKSVLPAGVDFGGWVKTDINDPNSEEGLRYTEFLAPMVKAIQELSAKNDALEARIAALEAK